MGHVHSGESDSFTCGLRFFFEFFFFGGTQAGRWAERLAVIKQRQVSHVERERASRRFFVDDHGHRTALDAVAERDAAAAGEPRVREALHWGGSYHAPARSALISCSNVCLPDRPTCFEQILPSREMTNVTGRPNIGPNAASRSSRSSVSSSFLGSLPRRIV